MANELLIEVDYPSYLSPLPAFDASLQRIAPITMDNADKYTINRPLPAVLSALDLALIVDTLNASMSIADNGSLFQYSAASRRETMQRVLDIMSGSRIPVSR